VGCNLLSGHAVCNQPPKGLIILLCTFPSGVECAGAPTPPPGVWSVDGLRCPPSGAVLILRDIRVCTTPRWLVPPSTGLRGQGRQAEAFGDSGPMNTASIVAVAGGSGGQAALVPRCSARPSRSGQHGQVWPRSLWTATGWEVVWTSCSALNENPERAGLIWPGPRGASIALSCLTPFRRFTECTLWFDRGTDVPLAAEIVRDVLFGLSVVLDVVLGRPPAPRSRDTRGKGSHFADTMAIGALDLPLRAVVAEEQSLAADLLHCIPPESSV
jgi:hypothetical protein